MKNPNDSKNPRRIRTHILHVLVGTLMALGLMAGGAGMSVALAPEIERPQFATQELPKEWRWSPPTAKYEHMYREK